MAKDKLNSAKLFLEINLLSLMRKSTYAIDSCFFLFSGIEREKMESFFIRPRIKSLQGIEKIFT